MKISKTQQRKQFLEKGYFIGKINSKIVKQLRKNFLSFFNSASELSNGQKIKNDSDLMKLYNSHTVAKQSVQNDKMMSAYMSEFVSFNVIDSDHLSKTNKP